MAAKNYQVAEILYMVADYLDLEGEEFKVRAYRRAARSIENLSQSIEDVAKSGKLQEIPGVGEAIAKKIDEFLRTGKMEHLEKLKRKSPVDMESLNAVESLGPKKIKLLYQRLGVRNVEHLSKAAKEAKIRGLPGFGELSESKILQSLGNVSSNKRRFPREEVVPIAEMIRKKLQSMNVVEKVEVVGSYRRKKETVGDLDILVVSSSPSEVMDAFLNIDGIDHTIGEGEKKASLVLDNGLQVDLRVVGAESYGAALIYFTGSKYHNIRLRKIAIKKGYKLNEYGLFKGDEMVAGSTEEEVYRELGLDYIDPENREE
ncbi:hypothetical protein A3K63_02020 [Candidatus Micrarchaeota archaeon RBG_16_49_10]|nr:MAG: hypothetical protein A3K63_02020 [Candidatus Micrarchaeota archaeon RBG_16_49_10]